MRNVDAGKIQRKDQYRKQQRKFGKKLSIDIQRRAAKQFTPVAFYFYQG